MARTFRLALAQINPTVGDIPGNTAKILDYLERARQAQADLVAFPEMAICGYPPEDLLFKTPFLQDNVAAMQQVVAASQGIAVVVGYVHGDRRGVLLPYEESRDLVLKSVIGDCEPLGLRNALDVNGHVKAVVVAQKAAKSLTETVSVARTSSSSPGSSAFSALPARNTGRGQARPLTSRLWRIGELLTLPP